MSGEYRRVCWRCQTPILPQQAASPVDVFSPTGPGPIVEVHDDCPVDPPPSQVAPAGWSNRHR